MTEAWNLTAGRDAHVRPLHVATRKVALVTGGTDGIGRAVALELARAGHRILFVGRHRPRAREALSALNEACPGAEHAFLHADLSLLSEAARVCDEVSSLTPRLDCAVLCAGVLSATPEWTREGLERNFVLNYLCRFLLTQRLARLLKSAPSGRLVLVSNAGKYPDTLDFEDLQHRRGKPGLAVSGRTQFANDLLAVELSERLRGCALRVSCVFPGVTRSSCFRNARGLPWFMRWLAPIVVRLVGRSPAAASITPVFLAHDPAAPVGDALFFGPDRRPIGVPARARHRERRELLWSASNALVRPYVERDDADLSQP